MLYLEKFLETIFLYFYSFTHSYGISILLLSLSVSIILTPFYYLTGILERREKSMRNRLKPYIDKINLIDNLSIRHQHLQKLYKSYRYSPIYAIRSLSSLLIQIPFFIAAYTMLGHFSALKGASFLFIKNLGGPDALLLGVNFLPILMTLINILSVMLMTNDTKERKQSYFIAVFFLILLYMSPAGLVLYWTCNNFINLIRYFVSYIKVNKLAVLLKRLFLALKNIVDTGYASAFFLFIVLYFTINISALGGFWENLPMLNIFLPFLYLAAICQIYNFAKDNMKLSYLFSFDEVSFSLKPLQAKVFLKILPLIILFFISLFVFKYEKTHYLLIVLALISVFNIKNMKNELKQCLKVQIFTISAIAFPAVLYVKSNIVYFTSVDIIIYMIILILFAYLLPIISKLFNYKLSYDDNLCFCAAFILSAMFIPLIRDIIIYSGHTPIDFVIVFAIVLFIINSLKKYRKIIQVFFICSALLLVILVVYNNKKIVKTLSFASAEDRYLAASIIPTELLEMDMKDSPSIYLFMHDAFPAKQLAEKLKLDYSGIELLYKKYNFKAYDVYSLKRSTRATMSSVFNMNNVDSGNASLSGNNLVNLLLQAKGYRTGTHIQNERSLFNNEMFYNFNIGDTLSHDEDKQIVLLSILQGKLNNMITMNERVSGQTFRMAAFANLHPNEDKLFVWSMGSPGHSSFGAVSNEQEIWTSKYYRSIKDFEKELQLTVSANPDAIIIFMSDHGPWLLGNDILKYNILGYNAKEYSIVDEKEIDSLYFRDSNGAVMAIRWPDKERAAKYDKEFYVTQDLFPIILAYLYDSDLPLKYKQQDTAVRLKSHKFDKGKFYPYFYKDMQ
ncbi:MAG: YidC/Oxa1 family membrane protein insertase [Elusimicrobiota bacterium]|jgi:YidC/Oxa1 family membrane protein insertase|nr:YidC/Oxa1 family membrane protein insertase [Elusimicrobiota bacterium]